jgi:hypothetical protein
MKKVYAVSERWGFAAIAIVAVLPPPAPMAAFMFAAGAMQYSVKKFLFAVIALIAAAVAALIFILVNMLKQDV